MDEISQIVGSSFGPGGKSTLIESDYPGIPNTNTKDGVTIFRSLGYQNAYKQLITEQMRDAAQRTATEAGDGTTATTIMSAELVKNLFEYCKNNPKESPQKSARVLKKVINNGLIPIVKQFSTSIGLDNKHLLKKVAQVSANGDEEMADAVMESFEIVGLGENSHVTIQELSGSGGYEVEELNGFPIAIGLEESCGKLHTAFVNDKANQRCVMEKPLFLLFDGVMNDLVQFFPLLERIGVKYQNDGEFKNIVIISHGFSEAVLTQLAFNFADPNSLNYIPLVTPRNQQANSQQEFLFDMAAFTGATIFGMNKQAKDGDISDLGENMELFEAYRFRSTVIGEPDELNIEQRATELETQLENPASKGEKIILEERLGKLTGGIARLKIFGASNGELREKHDRCEDAVCAVRSAIKHGCLPGACRVLMNLSYFLEQYQEEEESDLANSKAVTEVLIPALRAPLTRLLNNAGYNEEEKAEVIEAYRSDQNVVYDIENQEYGSAEELGIFDATMAVIQTLENSISIASVMGSLGGLVCQPRDNELELTAWKEEQAFHRATNHATEFTNEANIRP